MLCMTAVLAAGIFFLEKSPVYVPAVRLNEICSSNYTVCQDADGDWTDYIELYNASEEAVDLGNYYLSDNKKNASKTRLQGTLEPGEYKIFFAAGPEKGNEPYLGFKVDAENGDHIYLFDTAGTVIDEVAVPPLSYNTVYARSAADGSWGIFTPTPGEDNAPAEILLPEVLQAPVFSQESGFYKEEFYLEIEGAENAEIYYTLDGSVPTKEDYRYTGPVLIKDISEEENRYAGCADVSSVFLEEIEQYSDKDTYGFQIPEKAVDKCSVVRAVCIGEDGKSRVTTASYFIGFDKKAGYENLPVVSLVSAPEDLFGAQKGIYVLGETYQNYTMSTNQWIWWSGNYSNRGRAWERPAELFLFSRDGEMMLDQTFGIRIKGGATRAYPQKSFNLYTRKKLDGTEGVKVSFFDRDYAADSITLTMGGNDIDTKLKDYLVNSLTSQRSFATMDMTPCVVFLDGEYWGIYYLSEHYGDSYFMEYYGVDTKNVISVKNRNIGMGTEADFQYWEDLLIYAANTDFSILENYDEMCRKIDMRNYMEYVAAQTYIAHQEDWPQHNFEAWRTREQGSGAYEDGRWRWLLFDVNSMETEMDISLIDFNSFEMLKQQEYLFPALIKNETFKKEFLLTVQDMMNVDFAPERVNGFIDGYLALMEEPMERNYERYFGGEKDREDFQNAVEDIRCFFAERSGHVQKHMKESGLVTGELGTVTVTMTDASAGEILVNGGASPIMENGKWSGTYYTDFLITLEAAEQEGFRFVRWEGDISSTEKRIEVPVTEEGVNLEAVFEKR